MKQTLIISIVTLFIHVTYSQVSGNINFQNQIRYSDQNINIGSPSTSNISLSIKGLANVKADSYVAIFSAIQVGKSTDEVNDLMDKRIVEVTNEMKQKKQSDIYVDMISFVPVYEFEVEKKVFSKKNYNEVPVGFELRKNIHIKYTNPNELSDFIKILSKQEIYDLVRVDYFASNQEAIKKELVNKAKLLLQEKMKHYESLLGTNFEVDEKGLSDGFKVILPVEMYKSYESYNSSSLISKKNSNVNLAEKSTTLYYQPIIDKEFDFVLNPTILEPVIQIMYEVKMSINRKSKTSIPKEYILITPNGEMKNINLNN